MRRVVPNAMFHAIVDLLNNDLGIDKRMTDLRDLCSIWAYTIQAKIISFYNMTLKKYCSLIEKFTNGGEGDVKI